MRVLMGRPLRVGELVPPFLAHDQEGRPWTEKDVAGQPFVLYFYPANFTPGCTREAGAFARAWPDLEALGVRVLGVSRDSVERHRRFAETQCLPFTLLCDASGGMIDAFGATMLGGLPRRVSYLVGPDLRVAAVFDSHLRPEAHAQKMLDAARALKA